MFENKNICRTCLKSEHELLSIFASGELGTRISDYFKLYLNHSLYENDGLPQKICLQCLDKILEVKKFYRQCRDSEEHLRREMEKETSSTTEIIGQQKIEPLFEENEIKSEEASEVSEIEGFSCEETNSNDIVEYGPLATVTFFLDGETSFVDVEEVDEYKCSLCDETFKNEQNLRMHIKLDHNDEEIVKSYSENTNSPSDSYQGGINPTNNDGRIQVESYYCDKCDCSFRWRRSYKNHMARHGKPLKYRCPKCNNRFFSKSMREEHYNQVHLLTSKDESSLCSTCGAHFNSRKNLVAHMQTHKEVRKRYPCQICERTFSRKDSLALHLRIHTGEKSFQCNICRKRFTKRYGLVSHMTLHTGKMIKCPFCDKYFHASFLKIHKREHANERPYACDICPKRYKQKNHLAIHQYTHLGAKPFFCEICGKCFTQKSYLQQHIFIHFERPYKCPACVRTFIRPYRFRQHLVKAHGIYDEPKKYKQQFNTNNDELKECEQVILEEDLVEMDDKDIEIDITKL